MDGDTSQVLTVAPAAGFLVVAVQKLADMLGGAHVASFQVSAGVVIRRLFEHVPKPLEHVTNSGFGSRALDSPMESKCWSNAAGSRRAMSTNLSASSFATSRARAASRLWLPARLRAGLLAAKS